MNVLPISADSHIVEPPNCYIDHIEPAWRDRAPRVEKNAHGVDAYVFEGGQSPIPIGIMAAAGVPASELRRMRRAGYDEITPAAWDPTARLEAQDIDGVGGEIIFATVGMVLCSHPDYAYKTACFQAYNRWLAGFCAGGPNRLFGLAQTAVESVDQTIAELEAAKAAGMVGMMMTGTPQHADYDHPDYDALWACAVDLDLPICFHILTSKDSDAASAFRPSRGHAANGFMNIIRGVQDVLGVMLFGGVFERFPDLKMVVAEGDAGWVPHYMYRADHAVEKLGIGLQGVLSKPPSEYIKQNVHFTFQDDATAYRDPELLATKCLMWANDFPHTDSTWPDSQTVLATQTAHLSDAQRQTVLRDNVVDVFNLAVA